MLGPEVVRALIILLVTLFAGAAAFFFYWPSPLEFREAMLYAVKAASTNGVPDPMIPIFQWFIIVYVPVGALAWGALLDAIINRS